MDSPFLSIKQLDHSDVPFILDYWMNATPEYLRGMGADPAKMPTSEDFSKMLTAQISTPIEQVKGLATIWLIDGERVGHCNVNQLEYGQRANMHIHLWNASLRTRGYGQLLVKKSIAYFFNKLHLKVLYCEPYALNPAPNKLLPKIGFTFVKNYRCVPGSINFEQEVNQWIMKESSLG